MITENLSTLKIHKLTKAQYERELTAGRIDANALYLTPDEEADLSGYVTTEQLTTAIANADHLKREIVTELPNTGDINTIYMIQSNTASENNIYLEYMYINDKWEIIGSSEVDLTGYVKNIDYATQNKGGVVKIHNGYGMAIGSLGTIYPLKATQEHIDSRSNDYNPIVSSNLEYAVKSVGDGYYATEETLAEEITNITDDFSAITNIVETSISSCGVNIFNPSLVTLNKSVDLDGSIIESLNLITQPIKLKDDEIAITLSYVTSGGTQQLQAFNGAFYDSSMNLVAFSATSSTHNIPIGASYFIMNITSNFSSVLNRIMIQYGTKMTEFEEFYETTSYEENIFIKPECLEFVDIAETNNMYNYKTRTDSVSMNIDGTTISNTLRSVSDYISCHGKKVFSAGNGAEGVFCFYDENKTFISHNVYSTTGTTSIEIPPTAYYLRTSLSITYNRVFTLTFSRSAINYEKYNTTTPNVKSNFDKNNYKSVISDILSTGGRIKLLGDSITQGVGGTNFDQDGDVIVEGWNVNTSGYCWANLFKTYIEEKYSNSVINYGTRGIRSYDITKWLDANNGYVTDEDKLLIVTIGTNNKWATTTDTLENLRDDIQWIIDWCIDNDKKLILMSAPMSTVEYDTQYSDGTAVKFHNEDIDHIYKEVCYKNNMNYIPMYQRMVDYCNLKGIDIDSIFSDGLHPNDTGYYIMYKILMKELGLAYQMPASDWDDATPNIDENSLSKFATKEYVNNQIGINARINNGILILSKDIN